MYTHLHAPEDETALVFKPSRRNFDQGPFSLCVAADAHRGLPIALLPHPTTNLAADLSFIQPPTHDKNLHTMSNAELASSYAALILADDGVEITVSLFYCYCRNANSTYPRRSTADAISKPAR
ncbi:hypothetical protein E4U43_000983 [Claviceps pusilla]|uniref:Uncharacterized protein n=1 Tax=Claviceps pusilla TaxID=123648 RepID=A0A9P7N925_9HYPO|nr:hypothetical protein E4U43_000983 [Claviceps pusilla]